MNSKETSRNLYEMKMNINLTRNKDKIKKLSLEAKQLSYLLKRTFLLEKGYVMACNGMCEYNN